MSVLIDASNLRVGGGVQVAASIVNELARLDPRPAWFSGCDVLVSSSVGAELDRPGTAWPFRSLQVHDVRPSLVRPFRSTSHTHQVAYTVFGPAYQPRRAAREIVGFAEVTLVHPEYAAPVRRRTLDVMKRRLVRRADVTVVETVAMRNRVVEALQVDVSDVAVIPNAVSANIRSAGRGWSARPIVDHVRLIYPARGYQHKNHRFLGALGEQMEAKGIRPEFVVTLDDREWRELPSATRSYCRNVGVISQAELSRVYAGSDAMIFPSLLEAFSAAPLEALSQGLPLFASDRSFVREVCHEVPIYFDPTDAVSAAAVIADALRSPGRLEARSRAGLRLIEGLPPASGRAAAVSALITAQLACVADEALL